MFYMRARLLSLSMLILLAIFSAATESCAGNPKPSEYEVKAAYIYNFAKFVEWPQLHAGDQAINVCVVGYDPFGPLLATIEGKTVGDRKIAVKRNVSINNIRGCQMVFISASEEDHLARILKVINSSPVLTIGDTEGYAEQGVMINLYMERRTVRFQINQKAATRAGLRIRSNLLKIATIVEGP
jgi:hypothetical protein